VIRFEACSTWAPDFVAAIRRHYTGAQGAPFGRKLAWRLLEVSALEDGPRLVGWIGLGEPSYKLAPRRRLGLEDARPLPCTVSCFVYRLEGPRHVEASAILDAWHPIAARAWESRYGEVPAHWETMIGQGAAGNLGACFRSAGYRSLGWTTGRGASRPPGSTHGPRVWGDRPRKLVLYRGPLARTVAEQEHNARPRRPTG
jgi:hypothetical protein